MELKEIMVFIIFDKILILMLYDNSCSLRLDNFLKVF
mgnify:CR=1 FL=1